VHRTESAIATSQELLVVVSSKEPDQNNRNFFVRITLSYSYSMRRRNCLALLNANDSVWWLAL